jgi:hypothetical protein
VSEWRCYCQLELLPRDAGDMITHVPLGESARGRGWAKATPAKTINAIIPKVDFIVLLWKESEMTKRAEWLRRRRTPSRGSVSWEGRKERTRVGIGRHLCPPRVQLEFESQNRDEMRYIGVAL